MYRGADSSAAVVREGTVAVGSYDGAVYFVNVTDPSLPVTRTPSGSRWGGENSPDVLQNGTNRTVVTWGGMSSKSIVFIDADKHTQLDEWSLPCSDHGSITSSGINVGTGRVFVGTNSDEKHKFIYSMDRNGDIWNTSADITGAAFSSLGPLVIGDELVCFGIGGSVLWIQDLDSKLVCLHQELQAEGKQIKFVTERLGRQIQSKPAYSEEHSLIYVGDFDGTLHALDAETGKSRWNRTETEDWKHPKASGFVGSPTVVDDLVIIGSSNGRVYAYTADEGIKRWSSQIGDSTGTWKMCLNCGVFSTPTSSRDNKTLYIGSSNGIWALEKESGAAKWFLYSGATCASKPTLVEGGEGESDVIVAACR